MKFLRRFPKVDVVRRTESLFDLLMGFVTFILAIWHSLLYMCTGNTEAWAANAAGFLEMQIVVRNWRTTMS